MRPHESPRTAFAATGGNFILGKSNSASSTTGLSAGVGGGPAFKVTNTGAGTAANFTAPSGQPPLKVSNAVKVPSLNADLLDGKDSTTFLGAGAKAADADKLDGKDSSAYLDGCPTPLTARFGRICAGSDGVAESVDLREASTARGSCHAGPSTGSTTV